MLVYLYALWVLDGYVSIMCTIYSDSYPKKECFYCENIIIVGRGKHVFVSELFTLTKCSLAGTRTAAVATTAKIITTTIITTPSQQTNMRKQKKIGKNARVRISHDKKSLNFSILYDINKRLKKEFHNSQIATFM